MNLLLYLYDPCAYCELLRKDLYTDVYIYARLFSNNSNMYVTAVSFLDISKSENDLKTEVCFVFYQFHVKK